MLRIGICDDLPDARMTLEAALERVLEARKTEFKSFMFSSGEGLLCWLEKHRGELDLVFLDIEMSGIDGMETARRLRAMDEDMQLVFVTGYSDYVYDGYGVGALGYLLKPPKAEQLEEVAERALAALYRAEERAFICRSGETVYRIAHKDILWFFSDKRIISCVTKARTYTFYGKLDDVARQLEDMGFVRIHQRYLVRAGAVERIDSGEVGINGEALPISRAFQKAALLKLTRAMLGEMGG